MSKPKAIMDTSIPVFFKKLKSFKYNFAMNWSMEQQQMGMLNRGGDQGHVSLVLL